jgi:hypothetical protein
MMMLFQNLDLFFIEDLHNLAVKKASSLLLIPLKYFLSNYLQSYIYQITTTLKAKGSSFIINMK